MVIKRNGDKVDFDENKIITAILKANKDVALDETLSEEIIREIADNIREIYELTGANMSVEEIQDLVEQYIMIYHGYEVARAYIKYRYKRELARNQYKDLMDAIDEKLNATNVQNQNANVDEKSFGGRIGEAANLLMKKFALENCISEKSVNNHINNEIYIHDLDHYAIGSHNCLSIPFDDLLKKGFNTRQTDIRPANSINTAFQLVAVIFQLQSLQQFGGVSATHLDWTMVPYVRKSFTKHFLDGVKWFSDNGVEYDIEELYKISIESNLYKEQPKAYEYALKMTIRETQQAVEGMYHNLNTLQSRSGNQLPFTSINYGTCTLPEGRMIIKALLEGSIKGVGKLHKTAIFPCGIFQCMKGVNQEPGEPNYDLFQLALKSTAQRLYPNYANVDWSGNKGYDINDPRTYFSTMGKRKLSSCKIF